MYYYCIMSCHVTSCLYQVKTFMAIIHQQHRDKVERHGDYMKRALYRPNPATLPGLPRRWSPTRPRAQVFPSVVLVVVVSVRGGGGGSHADTFSISLSLSISLTLSPSITLPLSLQQTAKIEATSPFASTAIRPLSPPKTVRPPSPTFDFHEMVLQEMRDRRHVDVASKITVDVQSALLVFIKAARFYKNLYARAREYKLLKLRLFSASKKIQHSFKRMQTQNSLERYLCVPPVFTQYLYRWKRKRALMVVVSFINDVQNCKTKRIVRRFLLAVKKVQSELDHVDCVTAVLRIVLLELCNGWL